MKSRHYTNKLYTIENELHTGSETLRLTALNEKRMHIKLFKELKGSSDRYRVVYRIKQLNNIIRIASSLDFDCYS